MFLLVKGGEQKRGAVLDDAHWHLVPYLYQAFFYSSKELMMGKFELSLTSESKCLYSD